ncbi:DUF6932 family protein [Brevundimonas aurantiaca]|uniref:DUF6932 family protein n=1 Tax=Brevundimonas aurantiaca TaxID=74316 RepID=UPI00174CABBB|nr:hypothetical protein [Brevundimonas aurantiaca]
MSFEAFPNGVAASTPLNATPYVMTYDAFQARFAINEHRRLMLLGFRESIGRLHSGKVQTPFAIAGGSYLDIRNAAPKDLDVAVFYRADEGDTLNVADWAAITSEATARHVDLRLMPFDGPPATTAKLIGFFSILYSQRRERAGVAPIVVIDMACD